MEIRRAEPADRPAIRDIARRSLQTSYSLSPQAITSAIEEWYDEDRLEETLEDEDRILLVVEQDQQVVAFSESTLADSSVLDEEDSHRKATVLWLHVDPSYRGEGIGTTLFDETRTMLHDRGAGLVQGRVLADNTEGNAFYEDHGFEAIGRSEVEIDGRTHIENLYVEEPSGMQPLTLEDGETVYIDRDNAETGSLAAFHVVYEKEDAEERYGYYCASCDKLANAMDAMGRIECDSCGNSRKPSRWDAAYM